MNEEFKQGLWRVGAIGLLVTLVSLAVHHRSPLPPHSSHDAFLLIPQLGHLLSGATPDDPSFGMFHATWFSERAIEHGPQGFSGFVQRLFENVQSHTWIDAPHPIAVMALAAWLFPAGPIVPVLVQCGFFMLLLVSLYDIGARTVSPSVGLLAAALAAGTPGLFGSIHYIEPHLAIAAMSTAAVALLIRTEGLKRWVWALSASLLLWSLGRSGEGSGEVVIAGLVVVGPVLAVIVGSDRGLSPRRWMLGLVALVLPFLVLSDLAWMVDAMERVTRAFADPAVQTDVVEKGGWLSTKAAWNAAYGILLFTDYLRPLLATVVVLGAVVGLRYGLTRKWIVGLWLLVPWVALSWMQRKASWYGIALLPPLMIWAAIGLDRIGGRPVRIATWVLAAVQLVSFSLVPKASVPSAFTWLRDPLPLHDWRLRRIEYLQPGVDDGLSEIKEDLDVMVKWMEENRETRPVALMTMGTQYDYATRYYIQMNRPGVEVINVADPRLREQRYRSLHPGDFGVFAFVDDGLSAWPPSEQQAAWLSQNLHCKVNDPFDAFVGAIASRAATEQDGFYPLKDAPWERLGPGQIWTGTRVSGGLCEP